MKDLRNTYDFKKNKEYEETFTSTNTDLILDLMGADKYIDLSQTFLDIDAGIDGVAKIEKENIGVALRIRKPEYFKYRYNFTLGHHFDKENSQVHAILNSLRPDVMSPNFILQINGVDENGYCEECVAIKIQTDVFARYLKELIQNNTLDNLFVPRLASYEFQMKDVFHETNSGVDYYYIENNTITKTASNDDN
jgi:hypothetical protein